MNYTVLLHKKSFLKADGYFQDLLFDKKKPGGRIAELLDEKDVDDLTFYSFIQLVMNTKLPQIFAESALFGDGSDWNLRELSILGDIGIAVPVTIYDNGLHYHPEVHKKPFEGTLLYTPGALLQNDKGYTPADWNVVEGTEVNYNSYFNLYEQRLLPLFLYADEMAGAENKKAFITVPGLGCGMFAGPFGGQLGALLKQVLIDLLEKYGERLPRIKAVYFDPYRECNNERFEINGISLMIRPLTQGNSKKPQLCPPPVYEEPGDDFSDCRLFSMVAWDHVSWPGNDFYIGSRATDDGVKSAATDSMFVMTGIEGAYCPAKNVYLPPPDYANWKDVVNKNNIQLIVKDNLKVYS